MRSALRLGVKGIVAPGEPATRGQSASTGTPQLWEEGGSQPGKQTPAVSVWATTTSAGKVVFNPVGKLWLLVFFLFYGEAFKYFLCYFFFLPNSGILTMTALPGVSSIKARRSSGSSALCPNVLKVQFHKKPLNRNTAVNQLNASYLCLCWADKYQECTLGSGLSYRGTASVTKSGSHCVPWDNPALTHKVNNAWRSDALELGLGSHSFCR